MIVYLVEVTSVEQLVDKLKKGKYKSEDEIRIKSMFLFHILVIFLTNYNPVIQAANFDDDIVAGPQKMSLKCPVRSPIPHPKSCLLNSQLSL